MFRCDWLVFGIIVKLIEDVVVYFLGCFDSYGIFNKIQNCINVVFFQGFGDEWLRIFQIVFMVFGKQCYE